MVGCDERVPLYEQTARHSNGAAFISGTMIPYFEHNFFASRLLMAWTVNVFGACWRNEREDVSKKTSWHTCGDKDWITCFVRWEVIALGSSRTESKYGSSYASMILHVRHSIYKLCFCKCRHTWQSLDT